MDNKATVMMRFVIKTKTTLVQLSMHDMVPVGSIHAWPNGVAPTDWMFCEGQKLRVKQFPELFSNIGYTYSEPMTLMRLATLKERWLQFKGKIIIYQNPKWDPEHFNIPDLRGQMLTTHDYFRAKDLVFEKA